MEKSQRSDVGGETGSTLIEVMVATVILATGILFSPILHRMLHHFHLEQAKDESSDDK